MKRIPSIVGILNVTPDSFSDGNRHFELDKALEFGQRLFGDGADIVDIGGDSTRPGSACTGIEEEWRRISGLIAPLAKLGTVSVDTHHGEVARRAIESGAKIINDVSGGSDLALLDAVSKSDARLVMMHSATGAAHAFPSTRDSAAANVLEVVRSSFTRFLLETERRGISQNRVILDPGMGAFVSNAPADSFEILRTLGELSSFGCPLFLGVSRKGFLRSATEGSAEERDAASVLCALAASYEVADRVPLFVRVHNVQLHRKSFEQWKKVVSL